MTHNPVSYVRGIFSSQPGEPIPRSLLVDPCWPHTPEDVITVLRVAHYMSFTQRTLVIHSDPAAPPVVEPGWTFAGWPKDGYTWDLVTGNSLLQ